MTTTSRHPRSERATAMPVSEKQRIANVINARMSTGPRSPEGKARSRRNSLKHGLTGAGKVLADIARHEVAAELAAFFEVYKPQDIVERRFVEQAALASVRHNRAQTQAEALTQARCRDAVRHHDEARDAEVEAAMGRLDDDPAGALAVLRGTSEGCDALEDAWHALAEVLEVVGYWTDRQADRALHLLGQSRRPTLDAEPFLAAVWLNVLAARRESDRTTIGRFCGAMTLDLPDADAARAALAALVSGQVERWKGRGQHLWETSDGPARDGAVQTALVDHSAEGEKRTRHQSRAASDMRQSIRGLESHRREERRVEREEHRRARERGASQNEPISPGSYGAEYRVYKDVTTREPVAPAPAAAASSPPEPAAEPAPGAPDRPAGAASGPEMDSRHRIC